MDSGDRQASAKMGEGAGGRRASTISCGLHCLAEALGDRAHDRVDHAQPEDEPGLRVIVRDDGSSDLRGDDPADAQKTRQCRLMMTSQTPSKRSGKPLVWLRSCLRVTSAQASGGGFGNFERSSPMVSFKESAPLLTKESATAPLKALATLAMRMWSLARRGRLPLRLRTPKEWIFLLWPRCTTAITPGGLPSMATSSSSARSSAASAPLAFSFPKATVLPAR